MWPCVPKHQGIWKGVRPAANAFSVARSHRLGCVEAGLLALDFHFFVRISQYPIYLDMKQNIYPFDDHLFRDDLLLSKTRFSR